MKNRGFTVVELIVTLSIFGIMVSVAMPPAVAVLRVAKHKAVVREYASLFAVAKSRAVTYRRLSEMHFDEANAQVWVVMDTSRARTGIKDTLAFRDFGGKGVEFDIHHGVKKICFDASGVRTERDDCDKEEVEIDIKRGKAEIRVITTRLGKVLREEKRN